MDYFKRFNLVNYDFTTNEDSKQIFSLVDLTTRVNMIYDVVDSDEIFDQYMIKDGETPLSVSYSLYGTADYYWTILYVNNMFDAYSDWPLTEIEVENHAKKLYPGYSKSNISDGKILVKFLPYSQNTNVIEISKDVLIGSTPLYPSRIYVGMFLPFNICESDDVYVTSMDLTTNVDKIILTTSEPIINGSAVETYQYLYDQIESHLMVKHYESDSGAVKDYEVLLENNETPVAVTYLDDLTNVNEEKRFIRVIDPKYIASFVNLYNKRLIS